MAETMVIFCRSYVRLDSELKRRTLVGKITSHQYKTRKIFSHQYANVDVLVNTIFFYIKGDILVRKNFNHQV